MPRHLAIIMDGNGRWAKLRHHPRSFGHIKGTRTAKKIITECADLGIEHLTLYAFSSENWLRPQAEVQLLMKLLKRYLFKETENLMKKNIRFTVIGDKTNLPADVLLAVNHTIETTKNCTGLKLSFALNYGSRQEITRSIKKLCEDLAQCKIRADQIDESLVESYLDTKGIPDPDLIIRTSGEMRLSNFLLWQAAYSEFWFTNKLWPDFTTQDLYQALTDFASRQRRYGKVAVQHEQSTH